MADDGKQVSALLRRAQQLKRWEDSETNKAPADSRPSSKKVKFQDGCVFLAACSSGDKDEVTKLLERGADINTANVDGLTALHQACIDDNLDMVEYLVEHDADVDVCDNEGWTPLHATASCGFTEIARYLLKHGANVAAVNNDGDLAVDIAEDEEMVKLLQEEMSKKGVDAESARREEEDMMMADANRWLQNNNIEDNVHPKTGATALHVAAAKGYINVINVLLQAGANINAQDTDGWTPLHAAVHWGQEDSCQTLVDHMCDMDIKNNAGHTVFDLADKEMVKVLEELKKKQVSLRSAREPAAEVIHTPGHAPKAGRRSSVTRMSNEQKQNVIAKTSEEERAVLDASLGHLSSSPREEEEKGLVSTTPSIAYVETERQNELNKQTSLISQPQSPRSRLHPGFSTVEPHRPDMPKIDEVTEPEKASSSSTISSPALSSAASPTSGPTVSLSVTEPLSVLAPPVSVDSSDSVFSEQEDSPAKPSSAKDLVSRSISVPAKLPTEQGVVGKNSLSAVNATSPDELTVPSWRRAGSGLRKTPSTGMVPEQMKEGDGNVVPRSASSPRLDNRIDLPNPSLLRLQDKLKSLSSAVSNISNTSSTSDIGGDSRPAGDRSSWSAGQTLAGGTYRDYWHRSSYTSSYKPYYQRQQDLNQQKEQERSSGRLARPSSISSLAPTPSLVTPLQPPSQGLNSSATITTTAAAAVTTPTTSTVTSVVASNTPTTPGSRRSFTLPPRDEETETQRKARAKHARQTRRSTQGVSLEDIEKAEETLRQGDAAKKAAPTSDSLATTATATTTTATASTGTTSRSLRGSQSEGTVPAVTTGTTTIPTSSTSTTSFGDRDRTSNLTYRNSLREENSTYRGHNLEDRVDGETRHFRRAKDDKESTNGTVSSDTTSSYVPRSQRNALSTSDMSASSSLGTGTAGVSRSASLRNRLRNGEPETTPDEDSKKEEERRKEERRKKSESPADTEEKKETAAIRARRKRQERRSTGINYVPGEEEHSKGNKDEDKDKEREDSTENSRLGRYSASDVPSSDSKNRPGSYSDYSRSTTSIDEYKKLYEEEKQESGRLRKELEQCKKELLEAKTELDRVMKGKEGPRNSDTSDKREKRALERKLSEYEEELKKMEQLKADNQRLKDENGALIRVISKLSK